MKDSESNAMAWISRRLFHRIPGLARLERMGKKVVDRQGDETVFQSITEVFNLRLAVPVEDRRRIPATGPVIVIANHPTGAMEGVTLPALLESVRSDVRTVAHVWFARFPAIARHMFLIDPTAKESTRGGNRLAEAARWVRDGHMLLVYPAGDVARFRFERLRVADPPWRSGVARLLRETRAAVLPVYLEGRNSLLFYILSMIHPRLGTLLVVREMLDKMGTVLRARIGRAIPFEQLPPTADEKALTLFLRQAVERLGPRGDGRLRRGTASGFGDAPRVDGRR